MKKWCILIVILVVCLSGCAKTEISSDKARRIARAELTAAEEATITNFSDPVVERVEDVKHPVDFLAGKTVWKVTYSTALDGLLGPITFYIDVYSGEILWRDLRM